MDEEVKKEITLRDKILNYEEDLNNLRIDIDRDFLNLNKENLNEKMEINKKAIEKMRIEGQEMHPGLLIEGKYQKHSICNTNCGYYNIFCKTKGSDSDLNKYGIGVVSYFKTVKAYCILFFIISIIQIPVFILYSQSNNDKPIVTYRDIFFKTSIGNISSRKNNCIKVESNDLNNSKIKTIDFFMSCTDTSTNYGSDLIISSIDYSGTSKDLNSDNENRKQCFKFMTSQEISISDTCNLTEYLIKLSEQCLLNSSSSCNISLNKDYLKENCKNIDTSEFIYIGYSCYKQNIDLGFWKITRDVASNIVVGIDCATVIIILIFIFIMNYKMKVSIEEYSKSTNEILDYTIHIKNINFKKSTINKDISDIMIHFESLLKIEYPYITSNINESDIGNVERCYFYDINYSLLDDNTLNDVVKKKKNERKIFDLKRKSLFMKNDKNIMKNEEKVRELYLENDNLYNKISHNKYDDRLNDQIVNDIWITFTKIKYMKFVSEAYSKYSLLNRFFIICFCQKKRIQRLYFKDKWIKVIQAECSPSDIKWINLTYPKCKKRLCRMFTLLIAIVIISLSFVISVGTEYINKKFSKENNSNFDCNIIKTTNIKDIYLNYISSNPELSSKGKAELNCLCQEKFEKNGFIIDKDFFIIENSQKESIKWYPCDLWIKDFARYYGFTILISVVILLLNQIIIYVLTKLTKYERHKTLTDDLKINMVKCFLVSFINTGIIVLVVNIRISSIYNWNPNFFIFAGEFQDLTVKWYTEVGVILSLTLFLNIFSSHLIELLSWIFVIILRNYDKYCSKNDFGTRKKTKEEYFKLHVGEELRMDMKLSELLNIIFVCLLFSSGLPFIYVFIAIYLFFNYWIDKIKFLRYYRTPPKYNAFLSKSFNSTIIISLIAHLIFSIWVYSNQDIFTITPNTFSKKYSDWASNVFTSSYIDKLFGKEILKRILLPHNLWIFGLLIVICCITILWLFLFEAISLLYSFLCSTKYKPILSNREIQEDISIYNSIGLNWIYRHYQIRKLKLKSFIKKLSDKDIKDNTAKEIINTSTQKNQFYLKLYLQGLYNDRCYIVRLLKENNILINNKEESLLETQFDYDIEKYFIKRNIHNFYGKMVGDTSFNMAFIEEFKIYAHEYLLYEAGIDNKKYTEKKLINLNLKKEEKELRNNDVLNHLDNDDCKVENLTLNYSDVKKDINNKVEVNGSPDKLIHQKKDNSIIDFRNNNKEIVRHEEDVHHPNVILVYENGIDNNYHNEDNENNTDNNQDHEKIRLSNRQNTESISEGVIDKNI